MRKAIAYATDRKGIIDGVVYGLGRPTYRTFPQSSWAYNPSVEHYDFDTKKAQDLFKQAGYTLNGKKLTKDGQQLTLKLLYPTSSKTREGIATVMQQQLSDLGIAVNVQALEFQALQRCHCRRNRSIRTSILGAWSQHDRAVLRLSNLGREFDPETQLRCVHEQAGRGPVQPVAPEFDTRKRKAIFAQIQKIVTDDEPYVFLYEAQSYTGVNKRVGGITVGKLGPSTTCTSGT